MVAQNLFIYTTPHPAHDALADYLKCEKIKSRQGIPFFGRFLNLNLIHSNKEFDIILTESISRDLVAGASYKSKHPKTKLVALLTDPKLYELEEAPLFDKMLTYWALDKADVLLVGSTMMFDLVPAPFKHKTHLFYPGVEDIKSHLEVSAKQNKNFVFVGRLDDYKGTDILPEIFQNIRFGNNNATLFIAGDGPNSDLFKNKISEGIVYLGKTKNSLFMHKVAGIYISAARYEPSGCAILEAMAQGLVPIVTSGIGYADLVKQISPKLVCYTEDDFVNISTNLMNNKALWKRYSKAGKKIAAKYSYKYMINEFKKVLKITNII